MPVRGRFPGMPHLLHATQQKADELYEIIKWQIPIDTPYLLPDGEDVSLETVISHGLLFFCFLVGLCMREQRFGLRASVLLFSERSFWDREP